MNDTMTLTDVLEALKPKGTLDVVRLDLDNNFFTHDFVKQCIYEINMAYGIKRQLNPLEQLGVFVLFDSAGVKYEK